MAAPKRREKRGTASEGTQPSPQSVRGRRRSREELHTLIEDLTYANLQLQKKVAVLEREVVEITALEQRRIGHDLHDECGQRLTALGLQASNLMASLKKRGISAELELADAIRQGIDQLLREVRIIAWGLTQGQIDPAKLPNALATLADRLGEFSEARCIFESDERVAIENRIHATHLYHIAQEASTNALKHAHAKNIIIRLRSADDAIILQVQDDGRGLPKASKKGLGLRIMRNRAKVSGAKLNIEPASPQGTVVTCILKREPTDAPNKTKKARGEGADRG